MEPTQVLIDTNLFIEHIRARNKEATTLARIHEQHHRLITSSIVVAELCYGARTDMLRAELAKVLYGIEVLPFTSEIAWQMASEAQRQKSEGGVIGFRDLAIACTALIAHLPVATLNQAEFSRVQGLRLLDCRPSS